MRILRATVLLAIAIATAFADPTAVLTGFVTDPSGRAVQGAKVTVFNINTGLQYAIESNDVGLYNTPPLEPGIYRMTVGRDGFKTIVKPGVELHVQDVISVNFTLEVGSVSESVTVQAGASPINTTDASVSLTVNRDLIENLPLNGRSFQELITLAPGVNLTGAQNEGDLGEFSVNGQRPTSNYFTVDGVSANLGSGSNGLAGSSETLNAAGGTNSLVSVDALQEFRILTSSFAPEYGRTPGGQVVLLTRSGTNDFHGAAFEYFRNNVLDANDWFANRAGSPRAALRFNNYGGTFGGPIVKNSTFFFFSYEGEDIRQPQFGIVSVPDLASRQTAPPAVQALLNAFPVPNGPELGGGLAEFSGGYSNPIVANSTSLRVDHIFNSKLTSFVRYSYAPSSDQTRGLHYDTLSNVFNQQFTAQSITGGLTYAITPGIVNELRLNWSANPAVTTAVLDSFGGATPPALSSLVVAPFSTGNTAATVDVGGIVRYELGPFGANKPRQANITDGVSYNLGSHQLKFGVDYLFSVPILNVSNAQEYFFGSPAGAVANSLTYYGIKYGAGRTQLTNLSLYGQDSWRATRRLTVTYGVRWDINTPPSSRYPNNGNYVPVLGDVASGNITLGTPGSSLWNTQYTNFAPRLGMAYQLRQTPGWETVVRAGIGEFFDVASEGAAFDVFINSFPNQQIAAIGRQSFPVSSSVATLPPVSLTDPAPGSSFTAYPRNLASPRSWQWNVSIQQALGSAQTLTLSYVAAVGRKLLYDTLDPFVGPNSYAVFNIDNSASSNYQSLQLQYQRRLSRGVTATVTYAWSHSLDDASADDDLDLPPGAFFSPHENWGPSDFDVRHSMKAAFSWSIPAPAAASWVKAIAGGWGADGIITARSALPVDVVTYSNMLFGGYILAVRPDLVAGQPVALYGSQYAGGKAFNPEAFTPATGVGDLGRNALRGFDLVQTDLSLRRTFPIAERLKLTFRADLFNLFNHPNFASPDNILDDGTFGQSLSMANGGLGGFSSISQNSVFQTGGPRTVQFSLKLQF
jgi:hypothetical protein